MSVIPFQTTPNTCGVMNLLQAGTAFSLNLLNDVGSLQNSLNAASSALLALPGQIPGILLGSVSALATGLVNIATGAIASMIGHVTGHLTNMVNNLTMAVGQAAAQAGLTSSGCGLPSLGPSLGSGGGNNACANMQNLFGSVMGLGATLVSSMVGALNLVTGQVAGLLANTITDIGAALGAMTGAIAQLAGFASQMSSMIASETMALAAMVTDMISFASANALFNLMGNPCASQVLGSVGTPQLLGYLHL